MKRARTPDSIAKIATGRTGQQIASIDIPQCRDYDALRSAMSAAYTDGRQVAAVEIQRLDGNIAEIRNERANATAAYDMLDTEPALSFIIGYSAALETHLFYR